MNPEQALQILDNVVAQVQLNRADTLKTMEATNVLRKAIAPKAPPDQSEPSMEEPDNAPS